MAPFLQPSLSASSAVRPRLISRTSSSPSPGTRLASTRTTQLALMQSAPSTIIFSRSACCLRLLHAYRQIQSPEAAIREAHRFPRPGSSAAPAQAVEPACCAYLSAGPGCARKSAPRHACRRTPLIRVKCADAAAVAALPHLF